MTTESILILVGILALIVLIVTHLPWIKSTVATLKNDGAAAAAEAKAAEARIVAAVQSVLARLDITHASVTQKIAAIPAPTPTVGGIPIPPVTAGTQTVITVSNTLVKLPGNNENASTADDLSVIDAATKRIAAWGAAVIDWTRVTAAELSALYTAAAKRSPQTTIDDRTFVVTGTDPNIVAQGKFLRGESTTESERAFVFHNNADVNGDPDCIVNRFIIAAPDVLGNVIVIAR